MKTSLDPANNARYELEDICLNDYIGQQLKLEFLDEINCVACGAKTKKKLLTRVLFYVYAKIA